MQVHMNILPPEPGFPGEIRARAGDGLHAVEVVFRFPVEEGTAKTLRMLSRVVLEVIAASKEYRQ